MTRFVKRMSVILPVLTGVLLAVSIPALAEDAAVPNGTESAAKTPGPQDRVHYKKSKKMDFSSQIVEGKLQRPETSLITASENLSSNGILRLRENFMDKYAADAGEVVP